MPLSTLTVEGYRAFAQQTKLALRPLTLLYGYNSAGKSALLRLLPLIAASTGADVGGPLALDSEAGRNASFRELLSFHSAHPWLEIGLEWEDLAYRFRIREFVEHQIQLVEEFEVRRTWNGTTVLLLRWDADHVRPGHEAQRYSIQSPDGRDGAASIAFEGLVPRAETDPENLLTDLPQARAILQLLRSQVHWIGSLRTVPARNTPMGSIPRRLAPDGHNAGGMLAHDSLVGGELVAEVSAWFERSTGHRLELQRHTLAGADHFSLGLSKVDSPFSIPIADTGEGMAQVLPVITLGALARLGRLGAQEVLAIEHPELHLHPAAHAELATFFCELATRPIPPRTIIETHSENFLLRVQLAIAGGELAPELAVLHWVRQLDDGRSVVETITFDDQGRLIGDWPPGVFNEDIEQARRLLELRRRRGAA